MLRAADANGYPRLEAETPYEFLKTLTKAWPNNHQEAWLITTAYVKVRYGELPKRRRSCKPSKMPGKPWNKRAPSKKLTFSRYRFTIVCL
jgi:hypothetical protein